MLAMSSATTIASIVLYEGTTAIETLTLDEDVGPFSDPDSARLVTFFFDTPRDLVAGTVYRLAIRADTTGTTTTYSFDVETASYLDLCGGQAMHYWDRADAATWTNENLKRCLMMRLIFSMTDVSGGGGMRLVGHGGLVS